MLELEDIAKHAIEHDDLCYLEDGYLYFWINERGALASHHLRKIADLLDLVNEPLDRLLDDYFETEKMKGVSRGRVSFD